MDLAFRTQDLDFRAEVRQFIDQNWSGAVAGSRALDLAKRGWFDALESRGWSVPGWPVQFGGTGWTPTQRFIWGRETVRAQTPQMSALATLVVGPLLCRRGSPALQAEFLAPIREASAGWCCAGLLEGSAPVVSAVRKADDFVVNAEEIQVTGDWPADWMLCGAGTRFAGTTCKGASLLLLDMCSPGIEVHPETNTLTMSNVQVPVAHLVGEENQGWSYLKSQPAVAGCGTTAAAARVQLQRAQQIAAQTPDGGGASVVDDEAFQHKFRLLEVDVVGLEMLELRVLAGVEAGAEAEREASALQAIVEVKGAGIGQRIAELVVDTLGYYALPYPDELLIDNEGAVGHDYALGAIQNWLSSQTWSGTIATQKSIIAESAFDLE